MKCSDRFLKAAEKGAGMDIMRALFLLCDAYIDMCGVSLGSRTIYYIAGEGWLHKLADSDHELALDAKIEPLVYLFPHINKRYNPAKYDKYDIGPMDKEDCIEFAEDMVESGHESEELVQAVCAGLQFAYTHEDKELVSL